MEEGWVGLNQQVWVNCYGSKVFGREFKLPGQQE